MGATVAAEHASEVVQKIRVGRELLGHLLELGRLSHLLRHLHEVGVGEHGAEVRHTTALATLTAHGAHEVLEHVAESFVGIGCRFVVGSIAR